MLTVEWTSSVDVVVLQFKIIWLALIMYVNKCNCFSTIYILLCSFPLLQNIEVAKILKISMREQNTKFNILNRVKKAA